MNAIVRVKDHPTDAAENATNKLLSIVGEKSQTAQAELERLAEFAGFLFRVGGEIDLGLSAVGLRMTVVAPDAQADRELAHGLDQIVFGDGFREDLQVREFVRNLRRRRSIRGE